MTIIEDLLKDLFKGGRLRDFSSQGITNISVVIDNKTLRENIRRLNKNAEEEFSKGSE